MEKLLDVSNDYWSNFLHIAEENNMNSVNQGTPEGPQLGALNKRRSILIKTPLLSR